MKDETVLACIALVCLTILEVAALSFEVDGAIFTIVVAAIAGIAGYEIKAWRGSVS